MNAPSPNDYEDNGEQTFLEEGDIINEYDVDEEGIIAQRSSLYVEVLQVIYYYFFLLDCMWIWRWF